MGYTVDSHNWSRRRSRQAALSIVRAFLLVGVLLTGLAVVGGNVPGSASAQQVAGATLTVLRGNAGVLRADGTPITPAASGLTLAEGDQVATLGRSSALVTFFEGSEIELGADSTIVLRGLAEQGGRRTITIESVIGTTVHRVVSVLDSGSSYRVDAGGSVALVRGTVFAHHVDASGDITLAVNEGQVEFPRPGMLLRRGEKRTLTSRGDIVDGRFDPAISLFTAVTEPASSGNPAGTENPGLGTGSFVVPQQQSAMQQREQQGRESQSPQQSLAGRTFLIAAASGGTVRLDVASIDGFSIGDLVRIGTGPGAETGTIVGFGSILLQQPLTRSFDAGTIVERIPDGSTLPTATLQVTPTSTVGVIGIIVPSPTATASATATVAPSPTGTVSVIGTIVPSPTSTATATATASATVTQTPTLPATTIPTPTRTPTPVPTHTVTVTATETPTVTATAMPTVSATPTTTDTPTPSLTPTATQTPSPTATLTPTATITPVFPCLGPLDRQRATHGSGTTGTTRRTVAGGVSLDVYVELVDAEPNTAFDVWVDVAGGTAGDHRFVGSFTTDNDGHATFTGTLVVPSVGAQIDNEIIRAGQNPRFHQYIREQFAPCPVYSGLRQG